MQMAPTDNHGYATPARGEPDWDVPLVNNFGALDIDVALKDTLANRPDPGTEGRWFVAVDEPAIYYDDGTTWHGIAGRDIDGVDVHTISERLAFGGEDQLDVDGLTGTLADAQPPEDHADRHADTDTATDTLDAGDLSGASGTAGQYLTTDGSTASWSDLGEIADSHADVQNGGTLLVGDVDYIDFDQHLEAVDNADGGVSVSFRGYDDFTTHDNMVHDPAMLEITGGNMSGDINMTDNGVLDVGLLTFGEAAAETAHMRLPAATGAGDGPALEVYDGGGATLLFEYDAAGDFYAHTGAVHAYGDVDALQFGQSAAGSATMSADADHTAHTDANGVEVWRWDANGLDFTIREDLTVEGPAALTEPTEFQETAEPAAPAAGWRVWADADGTLKAKNAAGTVETIAGGA